MDFKFPDVGEGITEGEIVKWLVKAGDSVKQDQVIVQIETDKAVVDIPAPQAGKITKINFKEGDKVKVGQVLVVIGGSGDKIAAEKKVPEKVEKKPVEKAEKTFSPMKGNGVVGELEEAVEEVPHKTAIKPTIKRADVKNVLASPAIRKMAAEKGIDLGNVKGSGENGRILEKDLPSSSQQTISVKKKYDQFGYIDRVPLKGIRKTIAENMMKSVKESAQVTAMEDIDVTKLWDLREKEKKVLEKKGIKLTFMPFIIKAVIAGLKDNPILNSSIEGEEIIIKKYYNIGVAVETEVGLMVPVIKIAENKTITMIAKEIQELAEKARTRKIDIMDLKGSTFTITNYGSVGGNYGTPIINPGEAAILGLGRIFDRVVMKGNKVSNAKILPVSLTFDHQILDGAEAARFIESLKKYLEDPDNLLMDLK